MNGSGGQNLGTAKAYIELDSQGVSRGVDEATRQFEGLFSSVGQNIFKLGQEMTKFGGMATLLSAPLAIGMGKGISVASNFDAVMQEISARTGLVGDDLDSIRNKAIQMGADTAFSAQQSAEAMLQLLVSGSDVNETLALIGPTLDAAAASGENLGRTADIVTDIMAIFGLEASKVPPNFKELAEYFGLTDEMMVDFGNNGETVTDAMRKMQEELGVGADTLYEMWNASKELTPELQALADQLGITDEDWAAYNESVSNITPEIRELIDASGIAGSRLAQMFTGVDPSWFESTMTDGTDVVNILAKAAGSSSASMGELGEAFVAAGAIGKDFGISVEEQAAILALFAENGIKGQNAGTQLRSMLVAMSSDSKGTKEAWEKLGVSMYDATGAMRPMSEIMADIKAGVAGMTDEERNRVLQDLGGAFGRVGIGALIGADGIDEMLAKMESAAGAAEVAKIQMSAFRGVVDAFWGSVETLNIVVFTPFMNNTLRPLIIWLTNATNTLTEFAAAHPELVENIVKLVGALLLVGPALSGVGILLTVIGGAIIALTSPINLLIIAIAAFAVAWKNNFLGIQDTLLPILERLAELFGEIREKVEAFVERFVEAVRPVESLSKGVENFRKGIDRAVTSMKGAAREMRNALEPAFEKISSVVDRVDFDPLLERMMETLTRIHRHVVSFIGSFREIDFGALFDGIKSIDLSGLISSVLAALGRMLSAVADALKITPPDIDLEGIRNGIINKMNGLDFTSVGEFGMTFANLSRSLKTYLQNNPPTQIATDVRDALKKQFEAVFGTIDLDLEKIETWASNNTTVISNTIIRVAGIVFGGPLGLGIGLASLIKTAVENDFLGLGALFSEVEPTIQGAFDSLRQMVENAFSSLFGGSIVSTSSNPLEDQMVGISDGMGTFVTSVTQGPSIYSRVNKILEDFRNGLDGITSVLLAIPLSVADGLTNLADGIARFFGSIASIDPADASLVGAAIFGAAGAIAAAAVALAVTGANVILTGLGNAIAALGDIIKQFVTAGAALLRGDIAGALRELTVPTMLIGLWLVSTALSALGTAIGFIATKVSAFLATRLGAFVGLIILLGMSDFDKINQGLTGISESIKNGDGTGLAQGLADLVQGTPVGWIWDNIVQPLSNLIGLNFPDIAGVFQQWRTIIEQLPTVVSIVIDDIRRRFDIMGYDISLAFLGLIGGLRDTFLAIGVDIMPTFDLEKARLEGKRQAYVLNDSLKTELVTQLNETDAIELSPDQLLALRADPEGFARGLGYDTKVLLEQAATRAAQNGDFDFLIDVAPVLDDIELSADRKKAIFDALQERLVEAIRSGDETMTAQVDNLMVQIDGSSVTWQMTLASQFGANLSKWLQDTTVENPVLMWVLNDPSLWEPILEGASPAVQEEFEKMFAQAIASGDPGVIELLTPIMLAFGIAKENAQGQVTTQLNEAINNLSVAVTTFVQANPIVSVIGNIIQMIQRIIGTPTIHVAANLIFDFLGLGDGGLDGNPATPFYRGGYTGRGNPRDVAGIVHKEEYVVPHDGALVLRDGGGAKAPLINQLNVYANSREDARRAASAFEQELRTRLRQRG